MQNVPLTGAASAAAWEQVVARLPFPVFVVDARATKWPLVLLNAAFEQLAGAADTIVGRPVEDVVDLRVAGSAGEGLGALLTAVAAGSAVGSRRVDLAADTAGRDPRLQCWLSLRPLHDDEGIWGVAGTLLDDLGEGLGGTRQQRRDVLRSMAAGLLADRSLEDILVDAAADAAETAGAKRAAILLSDGSDEFTVAASFGDGDLPQRFMVGHAAELLTDVAWGRTRLVWSADRAVADDGTAALPFAGRPGWDRALVVGMRVRGGTFGLVAVGDPAEAGWDDGALERLDLAATLIAAALEREQLRLQFRRLEELLRGAVKTSAGVAGRTDPADVRDHVVHGIVEEMQLSGAALWLADSEGMGNAVLVASAGLPDDVLDAVAVLPPTDAIAETAGGQRRWRIPTDATLARAWPGHHLHVVAVPEPSLGALGVYSDAPLPGAADEVLTTLAQALAAAVHESTLHGRTRSVIDALQRQLQPRLLQLPRGFEAGHIYRSATAGVPIGGDFLDLFTTASGHVGLACGDVSGKGIEAATLSAMAVYSLRAFALQGALPRIVLAMMNGAVEAQTGDDRFVTMTYGRIDPREGTVELAVAGHPPPILLTPDGVEVVNVPMDVPVGILDTAAYEQAAFSLPEGCSLVLYTDGVTEARSPDGARELFGLDRLVKLLDRLRTANAQGIADGVWAGVQEWSRGETTDDCAVLVLRRAPAVL